MIINIKENVSSSSIIILGGKHNDLSTKNVKLEREYGKVYPIKLAMPIILQVQP